MSGWDVVFSFENQRTQGDNDRVIEADSQTILDNLFLTAASLAPGTIDTSYNTYDTHLSFKKNNFTLRLWSWILDDSSERDGVTNVLSRTSSINNEQYLADLLYQNSKLFRDTDINVRVSYLYRQEDGFTELYPAGTTMLVGADGNLFSTPTASKVTFSDGVFGNPRKNDSQTTLDLSANYSGIKKHRVRVGTGFKYLEEKTEEYKNFGPGVIDGLAGPTDTIDGTLTDVSNTPYVFMEDQDRKIFHISLQDEWSYARSWELTAGVRYDNYSDFGNTINPRAALVWETRYDLTTKLLYGKAFRPPSFAELYNINNPVFLGNKDLEPEKIETFELAFDYQPTLRIHSLLNVFYYEIEDLIEIVQDPSGTTKTAQNNKDQTGYGFELETKWEATDSLTFSTNFAFQKSKDTNTKETVADAPELQIYFNTHWTFMPLWSVDAQVYWIGERERTSVDIRENVDAYTLTNLTIRRKNIFEKFDITFAVRNLFDEDVREPGPAPNPPYPPAIPNDYSMEGRSFYSEIKYHF
jgi:iron complex outermembrane receptor protein